MPESRANHILVFHAAGLFWSESLGFRPKNSIVFSVFISSNVFIPRNEPCQTATTFSFFMQQPTVVTI